MLCKPFLENLRWQIRQLNYAVGREKRHVKDAVLAFLRSKKL